MILRCTIIKNTLVFSDKNTIMLRAKKNHPDVHMVDDNRKLLNNNQNPKSFFDKRQTIRKDKPKTNHKYIESNQISKPL